MQGKIIQGDLQKAEKVKADIAQLKSEIIGLGPAIDKLGPKDLNLKTTFNALVNKTAKLDGEHDHLVYVLALSFNDKATLSRKLEDVVREKTRLSAENADLKKAIDEYVVSLMWDALEWDVRLNGMTHNPEIFEKEITTLSIDELKQKIETLKGQVEAKYPRGRKSISEFAMFSDLTKKGEGGPVINFDSFRVK